MDENASGASEDDAGLLGSLFAKQIEMNWLCLSST